ncbi:hypothetical protein YUYDRAFT_02094 [Streptomyces sp. ScaeMP-e48]|uniref:hypothetical protein n=1 Tax=Streptomyces sp. ScaeMP-e48 TaxID=1100823 RepID=UPI000823B652|nr:hypothetical protein [Streptomyces sp. ScaeMP-e48]SCK20175.1 hypothetical protein YUYDRAFT_02094 [Streptomyces sp. ScaeMP-e48]
MRTRTAAASILLAATLTACSTAPSTPEPATTTSAAPTADTATTVQDCIDAVAEIPAGPDGSVPSDPVPAECADLSDSEYLDAYMDGISQSNQDGIDDLEQQIEDATEQ